MTSIRMGFDPQNPGPDPIEPGLLGIEFDFANKVVSFAYLAGTVIDQNEIREYCDDMGNGPVRIDVYVGDELVTL